MRHIIRRALVAICLSALAPVLIHDRAAAETKRRTVNVYNWSDYIDPTVIADFTKATGIAVRYDTFDSNDVLEAKLLAGRSGYDVVAPTAYFLERQIKAGVFARLDKSKLPNLAHMWPEITRLDASGQLRSLRVIHSTLVAVSATFCIGVAAAVWWEGAEIITVAFVVVVIGGLGSFWGVVLAALLVGVVRGITIHFVPAAGEASIYALMFLVLLLRPRGLLGERIEKFE